MLKSCAVTWMGAAKLEDLLDIDMQVVRWGNTSFDVNFAGSIGGAPSVECTTTYVVVEGSDPPVPTPIPAELRTIFR